MAAQTRAKEQQAWATELESKLRVCALCCFPACLARVCSVPCCALCSLLSAPRLVCEDVRFRRLPFDRAPARPCPALPNGSAPLLCLAGGEPAAGAVRNWAPGPVHRGALFVSLLGWRFFFAVVVCRFHRVAPICDCRQSPWLKPRVVLANVAGRIAQGGPGASGADAVANAGALDATLVVGPD